jgi:hypothetical protein
MNTPEYFELIASAKGAEGRFRVLVELTDKDQDFWESQYPRSRGSCLDSSAHRLSCGEGHPFAYVPRLKICSTQLPKRVMKFPSI